MQRTVRWTFRGASLFAALCLMVQMALLGGPLPPPNPALKEDLRKLAVLLEKNDSAEAEKLVAELVKKPDIRGVASFLPNLVIQAGQKGVTEKTLAEGVDAFKEAGYQTAAIGSLLQATVGAEEDKKKRADLTALTKELHEAGLTIADAAGKKDGAALKAASLKAFEANQKCRGIFHPPLPPGVAG